MKYTRRSPFAAATLSALLAFSPPALAQQSGLGREVSDFAGVQFALSPNGLGAPTGTMTGYATGDTVVLGCNGVTFSIPPVISVTAASGVATAATLLSGGKTTGMVLRGATNCSQTSTSGSGIGLQIPATLGLLASEVDGAAPNTLAIIARFARAAQSDNLQVNQPMGIPAWAQSTSYYPGEIVSDNGLYFEEMQGGASNTTPCTSAGTGSGPSAAGSMITDGTCLWNSVQKSPTGGAPTVTVASRWAINTAYPAGTVAVTFTGSGATALGYFYQNTGACTSAASGSGPSGTGSGQTDNTCTWNYLRNLPTAINSNSGPHSVLWNGGAGNLLTYFSLEGATALNSSGTSYVGFGGPTVAGVASNSFGRFEFVTTAPVMVFRAYDQSTLSAGGAWRFAVCGINHDHCQYVSPNHYGPLVTTGWEYTILDFSSVGGRSARDIIVENDGSGHFGGVDIAVGDDIYYPGGPPVLTMATMGDSYPFGGGVLSGAWAYPRIVADELGIIGLVNTAIGGCGYNAADCTSGSALSRISDVFNVKNGAGPDILLISNGTNDYPSLSASQIAAAQTTYIQTLRAHPQTANIPIIVLGAYAHNFGGTSCTNNCVATEQATQAALAAMNDPMAVFCPWTNAADGPFETGTGSIASPNGTGNTDFTYDAASHNNALGNRVFASRITKCVRSWLQSKGYY